VGKRTGLRVYGLGPAKCRMRYSCNRIGDRCVDKGGIHAGDYGRIAGLQGRSWLGDRPTRGQPQAA